MRSQHISSINSKSTVYCHHACSVVFSVMALSVLFTQSIYCMSVGILCMSVGIYCMSVGNYYMSVGILCMSVGILWWQRCWVIVVSRRVWLQVISSRHQHEILSYVVVDVMIYSHWLRVLCDTWFHEVFEPLSTYRVGQKPDCLLKVWNFRICWHRITFYISNCSVFYPE